MTIKVDAIWGDIPILEEDGANNWVGTPEITVVAYKKSGKYYSEETRNLKVEHYGSYHESAELWKGIHLNADSVKDYSPINGGFSKGYIYTVDVEYPDNMEGFCTFLWDNTGVEDDN